MLVDALLKDVVPTLGGFFDPPADREPPVIRLVRTYSPVGSAPRAFAVVLRLEVVDPAPNNLRSRSDGLKYVLVSSENIANISTTLSADRLNGQRSYLKEYSTNLRAGYSYHIGVQANDLAGNEAICAFNVILPGPEPRCLR